ncbi:MAG: TIGR00282 family metallophosphoesterase [Candidatus Omnitrophota bacterium]
MKILFIGDIVGSPGREAVKELLPGLKQEFSLDFSIANAENAAGGSGITSRVSRELFDAGLDALTSGDHIWKKSEIIEFIDQEERILRPANFPEGAPGRGSAIFKTQAGLKLGIINLQGRVFMEALDCPFKAGRRLVEELAKEAKVIIVDIHAEATSEKVALGWYLDGKVSAILGTHTHIPTADEKILPQGSAYITDVGMCGSHDSVIGRKIEDVLARFVSALPMRFEVAKDNVVLEGVVLDIDEKSGLARSIIRIQRKLLR